MESDTSPVSGVRSRSTEPWPESRENSSVHDVAGTFAGASSEALDTFPSALLAANERAETAESLPHELSELSAPLPSLGDEPITASTLQKRLPTLRQTHRSTAPTHPTIDSLAAPGSKAQDGPVSSRAPEPIPENTVPFETDKRSTQP